MFKIFYTLLSITLFIIHGAEANALRNISERHKLMIRQSVPNVSSNCVTECDNFTTAYLACGTTPSCFCGPDMVNALYSCVNCGIAASTSQADISSVESSLNTFASACATLGYPISVSITAQPTATFDCSINPAPAATAGTDLGALLSSFSL